MKNFKMEIKINFLLVANIIESNFTVFATDYKTFAVISNCDKETNENGVVEFSQHTTLWSRTRNLGEIYVEKVSIFG